MIVTDSSKPQSQQRVKLAHISTEAGTLQFLTGQLAYMKAQGFELHALSGGSGEWFDRLQVQLGGIDTYSVSFARRISPFEDVKCIRELWSHFRRIRPQIVHAHTPKGGLLGMIAAKLAAVPVRIYHIWGLPHVTATGITRLILLWSERLSCYLAHQVICLSHSNREAVIEEGICPPEKIKVLENGGPGIDAEGRFNPERLPAAVRKETQAQYGIPQDAQVLGCVCRIAYDKGMVELHDAWKMLREEFPDLRLVLAGYFDQRDHVPSEIVNGFQNDPRVCLPGFVDPAHIPQLYAALDVVTLPTYREGFGLVLLEAAAMNLPVVATRVLGCVDAVQDGVNGTLVPSHDARALADAISVYLRDPALRRKHGTAGRERALRDFRPEPIWKAQHREYMRLLDERVSSPPSPSGSLRSRLISIRRSISLAYTKVRDALSRWQQFCACQWRSLHRFVTSFRATIKPKRLMDATIAIILLLLLSPLLVVLALAIYATLGRPIFFCQQRPGLEGNPFTLYKFRTMTNERDATGTLLPDDQRLTPFGKFLRRTSLDELPELFNVLRGDMSLVGPRPLLMDYLKYYSPEQMRRHEVEPGITGWAQINGRNLISWEEKFALDIWYVDHATLWLDFKILLLTAWKVLKREGISQPGFTSSEFFRGS